MKIIDLMDRVFRKEAYEVVSSFQTFPEGSMIHEARIDYDTREIILRIRYAGDERDVYWKAKFTGQVDGWDELREK